MRGGLPGAEDRAQLTLRVVHGQRSGSSRSWVRRSSRRLILRVGTLALDGGDLACIDRQEVDGKKPPGSITRDKPPVASG